MEKATKTRTTLLQYVKNAMKVVFESKEEFVNNIDEIKDWKDCVTEIDSFSNEDKDLIKSIMKYEEDIKNKRAKMKNAKQNLEKQIETGKRPKYKMVEKVEEKEK